MDVLNFISWLKSKRQVTTVDASQTLIPLGLKDARRVDGYLPGAISVEDLLSGATPSYTDGNIFIGPDAGTISTNKVNNIGIGEYSANGNNRYNNINIGYESGAYTPNAQRNVALGTSTHSNGANTTDSVFIGYGSGRLFNNSVSSNTFVGAYTGINNWISGEFNTTIGAYSLSSLTTGFSNSSIGQYSLNSLTVGYWNTALGNESLVNLSLGRFNTAIGGMSGNSVTTGENNIFIGYNANVLYPNGGISNSAAIGRGAVVDSNNQIAIGSVSYPLGTVSTEALTPTKSWAVKINGVNYKIPLQIA